MARAVIGDWRAAIGRPARAARIAGPGEGERMEIVSPRREAIVRDLPAELAAE